MKVLRFLLVLGLLPAVGYAQETDFKKRFEAFKQQNEQQFEDFKNQNDKAFAEFLRKNWESFQMKESKKPETSPKPMEMPTAKVEPDMPVTELPVISKPKKTTDDIIGQVIQEHTIEFLLDPANENRKPELSSKFNNLPMDDFFDRLNEPLKRKLSSYYGNNQHFDSFDFYGHQCNLYYTPGKLPSLSDVKQESIAHYWEQVSNNEVALALADQLTVYGNLLDLNDWAFLYLSRKASEVLFEQENDRLAFTWFVMVRTGYKVKLGYEQNELYLLLPTSHKLYSTTYYTFSGQNYYVFTFDKGRKSPSRMMTYREDHPENDKLIQLQFFKPFKQKDVPTYRRLAFDYQQQNYSFNIAYHAGLVEFFDDLPMTEFDVFFSCPLSQTSYSSLVDQLKPIIAGKSETEAVNLLLAFVQKAFEYKTDGEQFGYENYLFPEETLHFPYSDCEDRSVLFARLVKDMLGLKVVGLDYPGHIATAVRFSGQVQGDYLYYGDQKYIICDPTYINARLGMTMPQYKGVQAGVIDFQ
jgi:hypothetical protein